MDRREVQSKDPVRRMKEIQRVANRIVGHLANGENKLVFFEGTRSKDGSVASTEKRQKWATDLLAAVDKSWDERTGKLTYTSDTRSDDTPQRGFQKLLLVVNTMTTMPDAPEDMGVLTRFRLNSTLSAKLLPADHLKMHETENLFDPNTLFGTARATLRKMLVRIILERQGK